MKSPRKSQPKAKALTKAVRVAIKYDPPCGYHIRDACAEAVKMARTNGRNVAFSFNGVDLIAKPTTKPAALQRRFSAGMEANSKAYRESPEGIASAAARVKEIATKQWLHDTLVAGLPATLTQPEARIVEWVREFQDPADDIGVVRDFPAVIAAFESAGYKANDCTNLPRERYKERSIMGRYIIGQAISCMKSGLPPHQITHTFVEQYFNSPAHEAHH
jgi:hypothetical protein